MFGGRRKKATKYTVASIRPLISTIQHLQGLPPFFWEDEFVLGFVSFTIRFRSDELTGGRLSTEDKGFVLIDAFTELSNMNGTSIARNVTNLATQDPKSPDFERGADYASYCCLASAGKMSEQGMPYFEQAKEMAAAQGEAHNPSAVVGSMIFLLWNETLRERFSS